MILRDSVRMCKAQVSKQIKQKSTAFTLEFV
nr:MAG TPA: hypothetical protein [Caudoviricetes sp.]